MMSFNNKKYFRIDCDQSNYFSRLVSPTFLLNLVQLEIVPLDQPATKTLPYTTKHGVDWMILPFEFANICHLGFGQIFAI